MSELDRILAEKDRRILDRIVRLFGENHVFRLEQNYYKFPNYPSLFFGSQADYAASMRRQIRMIKECFGKYCHLAKTSVIRYEDSYFLRQEPIEGEKISLDLIERNPSVRAAVVRLLLDNDKLWEKHGLYLDMVGSEGYADPSQLHNLLWDGERIVIFDFGLLNARSDNFFFSYFSRIVHDVQRLYLRKYLENIGQSLAEKSFVRHRPRRKLRRTRVR